LKKGKKPSSEIFSLHRNLFFCEMYDLVFYLQKTTRIVIEKTLKRQTEQTSDIKNYLLNLSILISRGNETKRESPSSGE
jgi:hypothetical protein